MRPAFWIVGQLRRLLPAALCALGGHFALYRSLRPETGDHAYLAWYEPLVVSLSLAALVVLAIVLLTAVLGRERLRRAVVNVFLPSLVPPSAPAHVRALRLALASAAFLVTQETVERTLAEHRLAPAVFSPSQVLVVIIALAAVAGLIAFVERSCSQLIALIVALRPCRFGRLVERVIPADRPVRTRRRNALADLRGLRAPPLHG